MKRRTISADDLETMAFAAHAPIEPPGPEGGWATATINGHRYRARVAPTDPHVKFEFTRDTTVEWVAEETP